MNTLLVHSQSSSVAENRVGTPAGRVGCSRQAGRFLPLLATMLPLLLVLTARAGLPEPDNVVYGSVALGTVRVAASNTTVVVEARRVPGGPAIASYRMGDDPTVGDLYVLPISLESAAPLLNGLAVQTNDSLYIVVLDNTGVREVKTFTVGGRGYIQRLDFGTVDLDGDGLADSWELQYFGNLGSTGSGDPDRDGVTNALELRDGTNPLLADARFPADVNPTNNAVTVAEVVAYALAWKTGAPWSVAPTNIPVAYVTRAGALWKGGEYYRFDTNVATAPAWWVNTTNPPGGRIRALGESGAVREVALTYLPGQTLTVTNSIAPADSVTVYAVEETPPAGWEISRISHGGVYDAAQQRIRWGLFFDRSPRVLTYEVRPPAGARGRAAFFGQVSFDGVRNVDIGGVNESVFRPLPRLAGAVADGPGGFRFTVRGAAGERFLIESSADLQTWESAGTVTIGPAGAEDFDAPGIPAGRRFFRAVPAAR